MVKKEDIKQELEKRGLKVQGVLDTPLLGLVAFFENPINPKYPAVPVPFNSMKDSNDLKAVSDHIQAERAKKP